jgi:hypothetical protein
MAEGSPNLYQDSRDDIDAMYGRANDSRDYGSRVPIGAILTSEAVPTDAADGQLTLFGEHSDAMKDAMRLAREMGERAAQTPPLFPGARNRVQAEADADEAFWRNQINR